MKQKGSQPNSRDDDKHARWRKASSKYYEQHSGPKGVIGKVPKLAHEVRNPVWDTQDSLTALAEDLAAHPFLYEKEKKYKKVNNSGPSGFFVTKVEVPDEDDSPDQPEEPLEELDKGMQV